MTSKQPTFPTKCSHTKKVQGTDVKNGEKVKPFLDMGFSIKKKTVQLERNILEYETRFDYYYSFTLCEPYSIATFTGFGLVVYSGKVS